MMIGSDNLLQRYIKCTYLEHHAARVPVRPVGAKVGDEVERPDDDVAVEVAVVAFHTRQVFVRCRRNCIHTRNKWLVNTSTTCTHGD